MLTSRTVYRPFKRAIAAAGVPEIRFHDMRHTFASQMVMSGIQLPVIQRLLGHADYQTTQRYAHLAPDYVQAQVERLDQRAADAVTRHEAKMEKFGFNVPKNGLDKPSVLGHN